MAIANVIRTQYLIPQHMDKPYIISVFIGAIVNLIANYLLIPIMDASGAAVGTLLAEGVVCIYHIFAVIKSFDMGMTKAIGEKVVQARAQKAFERGGTVLACTRYARDP